VVLVLQERMDTSNMIHLIARRWFWLAVLLVIYLVMREVALFWGMEVRI